MNMQLNKLAYSFNKLKTKTDIKNARQIVLKQAKDNPVFTRVILYQNSLDLIYKGAIPIILDLPDPNAPPLD